ncbi:exocyst complex component Sec5-domain-containing protein [Glomus cerebriforme]|uniref:Exocyst complex component SEC5 n=1 Tax=Glomus cerebriforme TaxID=658196 RepID=A0A397T7N1_9GLOM|nr:exocyst complex component Sec5-domain-containing protein [Glomus cerebriforme]
MQIENRPKSPNTHYFSKNKIFQVENLTVFMYRLSIYDTQFSEEAAVLKHYGLDNLNPEYWEEEPDNRKSVRYSSGDFANGISGISGDELSDDIDPLGLKQSVLSQGTLKRFDLDEDDKEKLQVLVGTRSFNPKFFLYKVHNDTPYEDLSRGSKFLRYTLDQKSEALRSLVQDNFDRFVSAKNTIDTVYGEMKAQSLNAESDYGVHKLNKALSEASDRAEQLFGPVLTNRSKADKIRSTLSVLEKYKYFFNLPSNLMDSIKQQKYDVAIRDYKKGKVVLDSTMGTEGADTNGSGSYSSESDETALSIQYRKVFDKVWLEVDKIMEEMKDQLFKQLTEPWRSMEEQEKTINILLELETTEDPVWHYLDSQYKFIIDLLKESYKEQLNKIEALKESFPNNSSNDKEMAIRLKHSIRSVNIRDFDSLITGKEMDVRMWKAILEIVKSLSDLLLRCLPDFWKLSKSFMDGKFQKSPAVLSANKRRRQGMDLRKVDQCEKMASGVIELYASFLSELFSLSSVPNEIPSTPTVKYEKPSFVPPNSDSVTTCYFLTRILNEMNECVNDINSINMATDASGTLTQLMDEARWRFLEIICETWNSDAKNFYLLEDWTLDQDNREITNFLRNFHIFHKYNSRSANKIAIQNYLSDKEDDSTTIPENYLLKTKEAFLNSLYAYLEGLVHLVFTEYTPLEPVIEREPTDIIHKSRVDPSQMDSRILLTISNLSNLKQLMIPRIVNQFETAYKCSMAEDTQALNTVVDQLDGILFEDYLKRKAEIVREIITNGILSSEIDWSNISKPGEVHSFVYEALLSLVLVHAQISDIAKPLVNRTLTALLESMAIDCLEVFQKVEKFSLGGMCQATLDIEFMNQTLSQYVTTQAQETLQLIYTSIEQLYDTTSGSNRLDSELSSVKQFLVEGRKNTSLQFLCFKKPK